MFSQEFSYPDYTPQLQDSLETSDLDSLTVQPAFAGAVYFVPGIGQAAAVLTGGFIIAGGLYLAGSWLYDAVNSYLTAETADQYISKNRKGTIRREFPTEYLDKTLNEIEKDAKAGNAAAKKAKKLLTDGRFKK